jgi:hypothetical protein
VHDALDLGEEDLAALKVDDLHLAVGELRGVEDGAGLGGHGAEEGAGDREEAGGREGAGMDKGARDSET